MTHNKIQNDLVTNELAESEKKIVTKILLYFVKIMLIIRREIQGLVLDVIYLSLTHTLILTDIKPYI